MRDHDWSTRGFSIRELSKKPSTTHPKGRICAAEDCTTRLSIYNEDDVCSSCQRKLRKQLLSQAQYKIVFDDEGNEISS